MASHWQSEASSSARSHSTSPVRLCHTSASRNCCFLKPTARSIGSRGGTHGYEGLSSLITVQTHREKRISSFQTRPYQPPREESDGHNLCQVLTPGPITRAQGVRSHRHPVASAEAVWMCGRGFWKRGFEAGLPVSVRDKWCNKRHLAGSVWDLIR